jgi:Arc/MetJ-type ribon-helix-helix transcriptional regulator
MAEHTVILRLNQQQLELIDRTVQKGEAADRAALIRRALVEHARKHLPAQARNKRK